MSDMFLVQKAGVALDVGVSFDDINTTAEYLRRYSLAYGKDFQQLFQTASTSFARGSVLLMDDFGVIIDGSSKVLDGLSEIEKKAKLVEMAVQQMKDKMEYLPEVPENVITSSDRLAASWERVKVSMGEGPSPVLNESYNEAANFLDRYTEARNRYLDSVKRERNLKGDWFQDPAMTPHGPSPAAPGHPQSCPIPP